MKQYLALLEDVLSNGAGREDRTGTGTIGVFGRQSRYDLRDGFPCLTTKKLGIPTVVSMNPIMVDGTGMCGACRVMVGDEVKFACVDGPEFDGHAVNFDEAMKRQQMYKTAEGRAILKLQEGDTHHGGCGHCGGDE